MSNFWDFSVWGWVILFATLLGSLLAGNVLKKSIPFLKNSLIPTSVLGGLIILVVAAVYKAITGEVMFDSAAFNYNGTANLEVITYHTLALGFIASSFKTTGGKLTKQRSGEIFNTGVTTVATYLIQGIFGLGIALIAALFIKDFLPAAGVLLPFGYGQGTGQALNYGMIYEEAGLIGGRSFGLTIAALGFLSASIGGVIHLNVMKKKGKLLLSDRTDGSTHTEAVDSPNEIPLQESMDKMTVQIALIVVAYILAYIFMFVLGNLLPGMRSVIYGFNFLLGVLSATLIKVSMNFLRRKGIIQKKYNNNFLMTRASNFFFDLMVVAGVAAIRLDILESYWGIILILGFVGAITVELTAHHHFEAICDAEMRENLLHVDLRLGGCHRQGVSLCKKLVQRLGNAVVETVFKNAFGRKIFSVIVYGFEGIFLAHAVEDLKGMMKRRSDKAQFVFGLGFNAKLLQRITNRIGNSFCRLGERAVQIKEYIIVFHRVTSQHSIQ